ncbi:MAG: hypothetical protein IID38_02025 [Planctomycetes bacterium]|nr:hypothetical protein [Planctomycetota bacterium]
MPTTDRTTIKAAIEELTDKLRTNLVADPPTATKPFRRVEVHQAGVEEYPRPFLTLSLSRARPIGVIDNDKLIEVAMTLRLVTDVSASDPHAAVLDKIGALEDYLDGIVDAGVIEGAEGFDQRVWSFEYPKTPAGARVAAASATQTFVVKVERQQNREPAS